MSNTGPMTFLLLVLSLIEIPVVTANSVDTDQMACSTAGSTLFSSYPLRVARLKLVNI